MIIYNIGQLLGYVMVALVAGIVAPIKGVKWTVDTLALGMSDAVMPYVCDRNSCEDEAVKGLMTAIAFGLVFYFGIALVGSCFEALSKRLAMSENNNKKEN